MLKMKVTMICLMILLSSTMMLQAETYEYDKLNRLKKVTYEDTSNITYEYDTHGNIVKIVKRTASGKTISKIYRNASGQEQVGGTSK